MNQYIYKSYEAGLNAWPPGELRLEGIHEVEHPKDADIFVTPGNIRIFEGVAGTGILDIGKLNRLPYFKGNESRHVFFDVSDNFKKAVNLPIIFIKCDARTWMLPHDTGTIQLGWPVEDFQECVDIPSGGFKYDISCHAWDSTQTRIDAAESCRAHTGLKCDMQRYSDFTGYIYYTNEGERRRREFRRSMTESRLALCGESIPGVLPYRFFEAMSAGRVPFLISSDYVLPFSDEIPYDEFILRAKANEASTAGSIAKRFLNQHTDDDLIKMGRAARHYWSIWLNSANWPRLMAYAVTKLVDKTKAACV